MKIYLAGATAEIDRARAVKRDLIALGFDVVSTWIENVDKQAELFKIKDAGNPRTATKEQRQLWAATCLHEVMEANLVWFLIPSIQNPTRGGWYESGFARRHVVSSGDTLQSIFCALGDEFETDEQALTHIKELRDRNAHANPHA